jgi:endonuclease YncB( thermonuclease family)
LAFVVDQFERQPVGLSERASVGPVERGPLAPRAAEPRLPEVLRGTSGAAAVIDGDTLRLGKERFRLHGIDAPESKQRCGDGWPAGSLATTRLQALTAGRSIVCQEKDRDRYGRIVAICRASGEDLGAILVREGLAWAFTRFSVDYVDQQEEAHIANRGVHAHNCAPAWEWRAQQRRQ